MRPTEEICERAINSPYHPEPVHEPARAFATISRAVRLTLVLQERMEAKLIAVRKGETALAEQQSSARVKRPVAATLDDTPDHAPEPSDRSRETFRKREGERFDELVTGPFDGCLAAIRADLGLTPDEDIPSDKEGVESALGTVLAKTCAPSSAHSPPNSAASTALALVSAQPPPDSG